MNEQVVSGMIEHSCKGWANKFIHVCVDGSEINFLLKLNWNCNMQATTNVQFLCDEVLCLSEKRLKDRY